MNESFPAAPPTPSPSSNVPSPAPSSGTPTMTPNKPRHGRTVFFSALGIIIVTILIVLGWTVFRSRLNTTPTPSPTSSSATPTNTSPLPAPVNGEDPTSASLPVDWHLGRIVDPKIVFPGKLSSTEVTRTGTVETDLGGTRETIAQHHTYAFYDHGTVHAGPYKDQRVYSLVKTSERSRDIGLDIKPAPDRLTFLAQQDGTIRVLGMTVQDLFPEWQNHVVSAPNLRLELPDFPAQLLLKNGKTVTRRPDIGVQGAFQPLCNETECLDRLPVAETSDGKKLFTGALDGGFLGLFGTGTVNDPTEPGCLIFYRADGTGVVYESTIPSSATPTPRTPDEGIVVPEIGPHDVTWDAAYTNTSTYRTHKTGGCGGWTCAEVVGGTDDIRESDLVRAGQTKAGDPIYVFKTAKNPRSYEGQSYFTPIQQAYDNWWDIDPVTQNKPSTEEFLRRIKVPVFLWKDALGRWVIYKNASAIPMAECGKPVIYLYPPQTTDVRVQLPKTINVTKSEPTYPSNGWHVRATPSGNLTLTNDGSTWNSLFWEGTGVNYSVPQTGFIVKQADVSAFLKYTLPKYGLNPQETKDFMEFWVPQMQGAPYYRLSFLTDSWSKSAPLDVQPKPTTSIRLFMDWQKLSGPISLQEPTIVAPSRQGFTLVEWGGLLR